MTLSPMEKVESLRHSFNNVGNTCFINATLQAVLSLPLGWRLADLEGSEGGRGANHHHGVGDALLTAHTRSQSMTSIPGDLLRLLRLSRDSLGDGRQHDAHEFYLWLLKQWHTETRRDTITIPADESLGPTQIAWVEATVEEMS